MTLVSCAVCQRTALARLFLVWVALGISGGCTRQETVEDPFPPTREEETISVCVIDPDAETGFAEWQAVYLPETRDTLVLVNGTYRAISDATPDVTVATEADWFIAPEPMALDVGPYEVREYGTFQSARRIDADLLAYLGTWRGLPVYASSDDLQEAETKWRSARRAAASHDIHSILEEEPDLGGTLDHVRYLYVPLRPTGCVFQTLRSLRTVSFPPRPSDHVSLALPASARGLSVGGLLRYLRDRLDETGHRNVLFVEVPGGMAVVARLYKPRDDMVGEESQAESDAPQSRAAPIAPQSRNPGTTSANRREAGIPIMAVFRRWFRGRPGEHRAVTFVVSDEEWRPGSGPSTRREFESWKSDAATAVPEALDTVPITKAHRLIAATYVFRQKTVDDALELVETPAISAREYLVQAGLLPLGEIP